MNPQTDFDTVELIANCPRCGNSCIVGMKFCPACGAHLTEQNLSFIATKPVFVSYKAIWAGVLASGLLLFLLGFGAAFLSDETYQWYDSTGVPIIVGGIILAVVGIIGYKASGDQRRG